ncbi:MAG: PAS domain-containing protein, partial [Planctomycetes bacterium]|nr:PAS domain-containing protein [Planctomycetota bacterium]
MLDNLIVTAEVQEGSIYNFLDAIKNRVIDFSSDGFLRKGVEEMRKLDTNDVRYTRLRKELIAHLRLNKKSLDKSIRSICIVDLNGRIIASTDRHNVNRGISTSAHFKQGLESACVSDVYPTYCCAATKHSYQISAVAPLVDKRTKTSYAVIVTCYSSKVLNKILSGQQQLNLGALSGLLGRRETLDTYLVNREKLLITPSKYSNEVMKRRVETLPVVEAAAGRETSGIYKNYLDVAVIGASMYFPSNGWTLCVEMSTKETFIPLVAMKNRIIILSIPTMLLAIFLAYVFSKRTHGALRESEERFKSFMDNNPAVAFMKDERGYFIYINATYMRIFKTTMENYIGKTDFDQWPVEVAKQLRENDKAVLSANKAIQTYEKVPTPDGILRDWLVLKFPVKDRSGSRYIGGVAIDVTERKQAERRLNAQHAVTQILTETVSLAGATPGIFKAICECLGWDVGGLWFVDTEYHVLRCADIWYLPLVKVPEFEAMSREITFSSGVGLPGCVWASGKPHWIIDVTK